MRGTAGNRKKKGSGPQADNMMKGKEGQRCMRGGLPAQTRHAHDTETPLPGLPLRKGMRNFIIATTLPPA